MFISLTTRLPRFSDRWDLSEVELSLVLLMIVLLAGAGSVVAELVAKRQLQRHARCGPGSLDRRRRGPGGRHRAGAAWSSSLGLAAYGVGLGIVDARSNMQAVAVEHRYGRPILPSFHGAWTFGGIVGASYALAAAHVRCGLPAWSPWSRWWPLAAPYLPREHGEALAEAEQVDVPWRPILLVGLGMVLFYMVDTASQTWGPTFLDDAVDAPHSLVALATLPYLVASLALRLAGDSLVARYGAVPVLRAGAVVGLAGPARRRHRPDLAGRGRSASPCSAPASR